MKIPPVDPATLKVEDVIRRWPRLVAHMMCCSLGYFSPRSAASAVIAHKRKEPFACEWYSHMSSCAGKGFFDREKLLEIGCNVIRESFKQRKDHHGYMAEYGRAWQLVDIERKKPQSTSGMLAGWF